MYICIYLKDLVFARLEQTLNGKTLSILSGRKRQVIELLDLALISDIWTVLLCFKILLHYYLFLPDIIELCLEIHSYLF